MRQHLQVYRVISSGNFVVLFRSSMYFFLPPPPPSLHDQVVGFSLAQVAVFIAVLCVTSVLAQTAGLTLLMSLVGNKYSIIVGLFLQSVQLFIYGIWTQTW